MHNWCTLAITARRWRSSGKPMTSHGFTDMNHHLLAVFLILQRGQQAVIKRKTFLIHLTNRPTSHHISLSIIRYQRTQFPSCILKLYSVIKILTHTHTDLWPLYIDNSFYQFYFAVNKSVIPIYYYYLISSLHLKCFCRVMMMFSQLLLCSFKIQQFSHEIISFM